MLRQVVARFWPVLSRGQSGGLVHPDGAAAHAQGPLDLDFAPGVSVILVCKATEQQHAGEKVLWEIGARVEGAQRLTLALDNEDGLFVRARDHGGQIFETPKEPREYLFGKWRGLMFGPELAASGMVLQLWGNNKAPGERPRG